MLVSRYRLRVSSSCIVMVSFVWGIVVFGEHVHSRFQAILAVIGMICGIIGMAYYSSPSSSSESTGIVASDGTLVEVGDATIAPVNGSRYQPIPHLAKQQRWKNRRSPTSSDTPMDTKDEELETYQDEPDQESDCENECMTKRPIIMTKTVKTTFDVELPRTEHRMNTSFGRQSNTRFQASARVTKPRKISVAGCNKTTMIHSHRRGGRRSLDDNEGSGGGCLGYWLRYSMVFTEDQLWFL